MPGYREVTMKYIDLHCDTLMFTGTSQQTGQSLLKNDIAAIDLTKLKEGHCFLQFFAVFLLDESYFKYVEIDPLPDDEYIDLISQHLKQVIVEHPEKIDLVLAFEDIIKNERDGKLSALLTIEDGRVLQDDLSKIDYYYEQGFRLITLLWNHENCLGFPNSSDPQVMTKGLKDFGKESIEKMNDLGMIIDVSHLSDGGFYDIADISSQPFMASHSNARSITDHPRNLTDDMISVLADCGGIAGLNFAPHFLRENNVKDVSLIEDMVIHLNHMVDKGGEDFVALGTDYDGVEGNFEIVGPQNMSLLFDALDQAGWSDDLIEKFSYKNAMRFLEEIL